LTLQQSDGVSKEQVIQAFSFMTHTLISFWWFSVGFYSLSLTTV